MFNNKKIYFSQIPVGRALARTKGPTTTDFHNRCNMRCMTAQHSVAPLFPTSPSARNGAFILLITLVCSTWLCVALRGRFCVSCYNDRGNGLGWLFLVFGWVFLVILELKVIIPPLFDFSAYGMFRKIPATPCGAKPSLFRQGLTVGRGNFQEPTGVLSMPAWGRCSASALRMLFSLPSSVSPQTLIHNFQPVANSDYSSSS